MPTPFGMLIAPVNGRPFRFADYPQVKLGFTTQNFIDCLPVTVEALTGLLDYAADEGYVWLELRDPDAALSRSECRLLADCARQRGIDVGYAVQRGLLDVDFWPIYERTIRNAAFFDGPKTVRLLAGGHEFDDPAKQGWTADELTRLVQIANEAGRQANGVGLRLTVENAQEAFFGHNPDYYGYADLLNRVDDTVGWQFDTANPFSNCRVPPQPSDLRAFLQANVHKLSYVHLKAAQAGHVRPVLGDNPLSMADLIAAWTGPNQYVALELSLVGSVAQMRANLTQSLDYLRQTGLLTT